ncbi:MAG: HAD family hydrolase [Gammaproteobacteria bacterium]|nr:HAD family hydrolase [Gammaproteobacteria bacterium]
MGIGLRMINKSIFLDRDGVLNQSIVIDGKPFPPSSLQDLVIPKDVPDALVRLKAAGFYLIGITNQPDVARQKTSKECVLEIHQFLIKKLRLDDILVCLHDDKDGCSCRKPKPGLIFEAAKKYHIDCSQSYMIGDRWKDIEAGYQARCKTILIQNYYNEQSSSIAPNLTTTTLQDAANWIINGAQS